MSVLKGLMVAAALLLTVPVVLVLYLSSKSGRLVVGAGERLIAGIDAVRAWVLEMIGRMNPEEALLGRAYAEKRARLNQKAHDDDL